MKYLTIILLLVSLNLSAQELVYMPDNKDVISKGAKSLIMDIAWITLDAMSDAYMNPYSHNTNPYLGHVLGAASKGILVSEALFIDFQKEDWKWKLPAVILLRLAIFDPIYNKSAGLPIEYVGKTSYYDNFLNEMNAPKGSLWFARGCVFSVGVTFNLVYGNGLD